MSGLEELGIPGGDHLREALTVCSDPIKAIEEFQQQNGILLPSLKPALPFLDLHGVKRLEFHQSTLEEMRDRLLQRVSELAKNGRDEDLKVLEDLLEKSFPVVKVKSVRPVVLCILKHLPEIKEHYLTAILEDKDLYSEAATEVKRQIWQDKQALFGDEVSPLFSQYITEKDAALFSHESAGLTFFLPSPKVRRQSEVVTKLVHMVGKSVKLYDMVLRFLRTLFLRTRNRHYCTLRAELLMAIHDLEVNEICSVDPCHKFAWCVDACIREKNVNTNRARELQGFLDGIKKGQEYVLGDLSMVLCDPFALNTIVLSAMKVLHQCINSDTLPRESTDLQLLVRMIALGLGAWDMIDSQVFREPRLEAHFFTKYLPSIIGMIVDDQVRAVTTKLPDGVPKPPQLPSELYATYIKQNPIASLMAMYYVLGAAHRKDRPAVCQVLPTLIHCENDRAYEDTFLHYLISYLIPFGDDFTSEEFCTAVFDDFLLPAISNENTVKHLLRLLWHVHRSLTAQRLETIMEAVQPDKEHSEVVHKTYQMLKEKIASYEPSPVPVPEEHDSPLMSVPVPTPMPS